MTGADRTAFTNNLIPQDRISPIAPQAAGVHSAAEHRRCDVRPEQLPAGADAREDHRRLRHEGQLHGDREGPGVASVSASCGPIVFDPGLYGEFGGPANGGFAGTGTNTSYSSAGTWTRVFSAKTVLDVRGGLNYYHNVTSTTGNGLTTSTDVGIPGANLDEFTSGLSQISIGGYRGSGARVLGQPAVGSLGEDLELQRRC